METIEKMEEYGFKQQAGKYLIIEPIVGESSCNVLVNKLEAKRRGGYSLPFTLERVSESATVASGTGTIIDESVTGVKMLELQEGYKYVLWGKRNPPTSHYL